MTFDTRHLQPFTRQNVCSYFQWQKKQNNKIIPKTAHQLSKKHQLKNIPEPENSQQIILSVTWIPTIPIEFFF